MTLVVDQGDGAVLRGDVGQAALAFVGRGHVVVGIGDVFGGGGGEGLGQHPPSVVPRVKPEGRLRHVRDDGAPVGDLGG